MNTCEPQDASHEFALLPTVTALVAGEMSARRAVQTALERVRAVEDEVHAWVVLDEEGALARADELDRLPADRRGPLHGLPVGVKDIVDVQGFPTRCGSAVTRDEPAAADAPVVRALRDAGAVILGKTVTTEFAYFTPGATCNPRRLTHTPGGSSSGSAASVAAGMVPLAVGTQTAASVTRPAAYCGVFSVVVPRGLMNTGGIAGLAESLDAPGFLGADARGLAAELDAVLPTNATAAPTISTLHVWRPGASFDIQPDMLAAVDRVVDRARNAGLVIEELDFDDAATELVDAHSVIMAFEAARQSDAATMPRDALSAALRQLLDAGTDIDDARYRSAQDRVRARAAELDELLHGGTAALLAPAAQGAAPHGLTATGNPIMSRPWQALGTATVTFPSSVNPEGLPLSTQLIGAGDGRALLRCADGLAGDVR